MDWELAINRNRDALLRVVATLIASVGLAQGRMIETLPRHLRSFVFRILRTAESAARRLIVIEARELVPLAPSRPGDAPIGVIAKGTGERRLPAFPLFDPRKRLELGMGARHPGHAKGPGPRIFLFDGFDPVIEPVAEAAIVSPVDPVDAVRLGRRLLSLQRALENLPGQARRLMRARARRHAGFEPMRPGWPPGHRSRKIHPVDDILSDCDGLARYAMRPPDT